MIAAHIPPERLMIECYAPNGEPALITFNPHDANPAKTDYVTSKQAAARLGVDAAHIARLVRESRLHGIKLGNNWFVSVSSLDDYLKTKAACGRPATHIQAEGSAAQ